MKNAFFFLGKTRQKECSEKNIVVVEAMDYTSPKTQEVVSNYNFTGSTYKQKITFSKGNMLVETSYLLSPEEKVSKLKIESPDDHDFYNILFNLMQAFWNTYEDKKEGEDWQKWKDNIRHNIWYKRTPILDWRYYAPYTGNFYEWIGKMIEEWNEETETKTT